MPLAKLRDLDDDVQPGSGAGRHFLTRYVTYYYLYICGQLHNSDSNPKHTSLTKAKTHSNACVYLPRDPAPGTVRRYFEMHFSLLPSPTGSDPRNRSQGRIRL